MGKIIVKAVIETLGAPKEYVEGALKEYIESLKKTGLNILSEIHHEGVPVDNLFSTFVDLELNFEKIDELLGFCFDSMPSSIEIVEPEELIAKSNEISSFLNDLQARIHQNDLVVKSYKAKNEILENNTMAVFQNFILFIIRQGPKSLNELSTMVGIEPKELEPFVEKLVEKNRVKHEQEKYAIV